MKTFKLLIIFSLTLFNHSNAQEISVPSSTNCEEPSPDHCDICEDEYVYECVNEWVHYELNDDPATDGLLVGEYLGNPIFIGRGEINGGVGANRIQITDPKGAYQVYGGSETYINDSARMWYLKRNPDHLYKWVVKEKGEKVDYAVDTGDCEIDEGFLQYITKVELEGSVTVGLAVGDTNYYADLSKVMRISKDFAVLTCRSKVYQPKPNCPPKPSTSTPPESTSGCHNEWKPFIGDDAPAADGVPAGLYDSKDMLYVGLTLRGSNKIPKGLLLDKPVEDSFYLVQNPNFSYRWVDSEIGELIPNAVKVAYTDDSFFYVARVQINGQMIVGGASHGIGFLYFDKDGEGRFANQFQVLVCDPQPACPCDPNWIPYKNDMAPELDGFSFGIIKDHTNYIGRTVQKLPEGWSTVIGRVHLTHGVHYLNDASGREEVDEEDGEYLQKDSESIYSWITTHTDQQVKNTIKVPLRCENFTTCDVSCDSDSATGFIGKATIDGVTYVGTVYKNEGLVIADSCGSKMTLSNFEVLTCARSGRCNKEERSCGNTECGWKED